MTTQKRTLKRLTIHDKQLILDRYKDGLNGREISEVTGLSHSAVNYYLSKIKKRTGQKSDFSSTGKAPAATTTEASPVSYRRGKAPVPQHKLDRLFRMYDKGRSVGEIAEKLKIGRSTVSRYITTRNRANGTHQDYEAYDTQYLKKPETTNNLVKEIVDEIRADLKAQILKELLGK